MSFYKEVLAAVQKAASENIANIRVTTEDNAVLIDVLNVTMNHPINFVCCNPTRVVAAVPGGRGALDALLPHVAAPTDQQKADAIRGIADIIGQAGIPVIVGAVGVFPNLADGLQSSVEHPRHTNTVRLCINTRGRQPFIASMFPIVN